MYVYVCMRKDFTMCVDIAMNHHVTLPSVLHQSRVKQVGTELCKAEHSSIELLTTDQLCSFKTFAKRAMVDELSGSFI